MNEVLYTVKTERTAKGVRYEIIVQDGILKQALENAVWAYGEMEKQLKEAGHIVAPIEAVKGEKT